MEFTGLVRKYRVNRPLTDEERLLQLKQNERLDVQPLYQLSVIRMNSTYLEMTDKYYPWKGSLTTACAMGLAVLLAGLGAAVYVLYLAQDSAQHAARDAAWVTAVIVAMYLPILAFLFWLAGRDSFTYTHYPIRCNRKTRIVHVTRLDGSVLSVRWEKIFFHLGRCSGVNQWDIRAHVLGPDGATVRETFSLSDWSAGSTAHATLRAYWEFVRRYMEDSAGSQNANAHYCLPIAERKESIRLGFELMFATFSRSQFLVRLFGMLIAGAFVPGRAFAILSSKIPAWPPEIDAADHVDPGDPFIKDASTNPRDLRL